MKSIVPRELTVAGALLSASLMTSAFPPLAFWPFVLVGIFYFAVPLAQKNLVPANCARYFFFFSFFINIFGFYWLAHTLNEFGGLPLFLSVPVTLLIFAFGSVFSAVFGYFWPISSKYLARKVPKIPQAFFLGLWLIAWDAFDIRLFPWSPVNAFGVDRTLMASVHFLGTMGWRIIFFALIAFWVWLVNHQSQTIKRKLIYYFVPSCSLFFATVFAIGLIQLKSFKRKFPNEHSVALIQGNVGNYEKKLSKLQIEPTVKNVLRIHQDLIENVAIHFSSQNVSDPWVIWPETSFPGFPMSDLDLQEVLLRWVRITGGVHIVGAYQSEFDEWGDRREKLDFNVVVLADAKNGISSFYQKMIRLPLGEYVPGDEWIPSIYDRFPQLIHFGRGREFKLLPHPDPNGPVFVPFVCYEILMHGFVSQFVEHAKKLYPGREIVLVNPSNDSWYGESSEHLVHSLLARWQAARVGLPLLRPTNTGLSQIVAPWGEVLAQGPRNESVVVFGKIPRP